MAAEAVDGGKTMPNQFEHNAHSFAPPDAIEYEELSNVISLEGIQYTRDTYLDDELNVLQPRLVSCGFTDIKWRMGDSDAFGPLTRVCTCRDAAGELRFFVYG